MSRPAPAPVASLPHTPNLTPKTGHALDPSLLIALLRHACQRPWEAKQAQVDVWVVCSQRRRRRSVEQSGAWSFILVQNRSGSCSTIPPAAFEHTSTA